MSAPRILAVDDQPENLELLGALLGDEGFEVRFARDGVAALEEVERSRPHAVLLDIMMPRLDGIEVCRRLKSRRPTCFLPVVLLTALSDTESKVRGYDAGADDFLNKPFHRAELLARLRSLLRIRSLRDELDTTEAVLFSMIELLEGKDPRRRQHSARVAALSAAAARRLRLDAGEVHDLVLGAALHDLGKLGVPEAILLKPAERRTEAERLAYREHVAIGPRILGPLESLAGALPIVRHHHERLDGSGYPDGLAGDAFAPAIEVVAAANAFDLARTEGRVADAALAEELARGAFRSETVAALLAAAAEEGDIEPPPIDDLLPAPAIGRGGTLLVADDSATNRDLYRQLLEGEGFRTRLAASGAEALDVWRRERIDLMILDVRMPGISGEEVCRRVKAEAAGAYLPVILVTAYEEGTLRMRALQSAADDLLISPVNRLELLARVRSLLRLDLYHRDLVRHESVVLSLSAALEAKDPYTRGHSQRVGELAARLARRLDFDATQVAEMRTAGLLHDIGKVAVPQAVLDKPGRLEPDEWAAIMAHPVVGYEVCRNLRTAAPILDSILFHHERFDGKGYPRGLVGEAIPFQARLLSVVDAYDALISERAYRAGMSPREALALLRDETESGKWDPEIFSAFEVLALSGEADVGAAAGTAQPGLGS
ncbi:MAG: response regulator [Acidobacteria bacterium]|nr:response regulator [Acidobacteriota bacterium]